MGPNAGGVKDDLLLRVMALRGPAPWSYGPWASWEGRFATTAGAEARSGGCARRVRDAAQPSATLALVELEVRDGLGLGRVVQPREAFSRPSAARSTTLKRSNGRRVDYPSIMVAPPAPGPPPPDSR